MIHSTHSPTRDTLSQVFMIGSYFALQGDSITVSPFYSPFLILPHNPSLSALRISYRLWSQNPFLSKHSSRRLCLRPPCYYLWPQGKDPPCMSRGAFYVFRYSHSFYLFLYKCDCTIKIDINQAQNKKVYFLGKPVGIPIKIEYNAQYQSSLLTWQFSITISSRFIVGFTTQIGRASCRERV